MIILLTRKFKPETGGMETFSVTLDEQLPLPHTTIHFGHSQRDIVWALPRLLWGAFTHRKTATAYHLGDGVLAILAPLIRLFSPAPIFITIHALELTYNSAVLRFFIKKGLPACTHIVAVSDYTQKLLLSDPWNTPAERVTVIPHGAPMQNRENAPESARTTSRESVQKTCQQIEHQNSSSETIWLLTVGRLVERKGVAWFIEHCLPTIVAQHPQILYLVTGTGPEQATIEATIKKVSMGHHVVLLGRVSDTLLIDLYRGADIFVMPNIPIANDAEGFGFVGIEAASYELPVIATTCEGIPTAIHDTKNGRLVEPRDAHAMTTQIIEWIQHPTERQAFGIAAAQYTKEHFDWPVIMQRYATLFSEK